MIIDDMKPRALIFFSTASKTLQHLGGFVNSKNTEGNTPLHYACIGGHLGVGELLLRHGADRDAVNFTASASPLHVAAKHGHLSMVELLMLYNAVTDNRDGKLRTPLHRYSGLGFIFGVVAEMKVLDYCPKDK